MISRTPDIDLRRSRVEQRRIALAFGFLTIENPITIGVTPGRIRREFAFAGVVKSVTIRIDAPRVAGRVVRLVGVRQGIDIRSLKGAFSLASAGRLNDCTPLDSFSLIVKFVVVGVSLRRVTRDVEVDASGRVRIVCVSERSVMSCLLK